MKCVVARGLLVRSMPRVHFVVDLKNLPLPREALSSIIYVVVIIQIERIALGVKGLVIMIQI